MPGVKCPDRGKNLIWTVEDNMNNKTVIVTGGSSGIGHSIVGRLAEEGHEVCFTYCSSGRAAHELNRCHPNALPLQVDFLKPASFDAFLNKLTTLPVPDTIINNFGVNHDSLFLNQSLDDFFTTFDQNFRVPVAITKMLLNGMIERRGGNIIYITSVAASHTKIGNSAYGTSKASLERFAKSLALEVARFGIKVNCIAPGFVDTPLLNRYLESSHLDKKTLLKNTPFRKLLIPDDIANIVMSLINGTLNTTGSVISVGNGENIQ